MFQLSTLNSFSFHLSVCFLRSGEMRCSELILSCTLLHCIKQTRHFHFVWCISPLTAHMNGSYVILCCDANLKCLWFIIHYSQSTIQFITVCPSCSVRWADHRYRSAFQTVPLTLWENSIEILHYIKCNSSNCNNRLTKISFFANTPESSSTSTSREKILFSYNPSYVVVMGLNLIGYDNILLTSSLLRSTDMMA